MNIRKALYRNAVMIGISGFALAYSLATADAQQVVDAPFAKFQERYGAEWAEDDKIVDQKLAELEAKFGKKPNIIMVLTDDIGWGTLGAYGGGKVVGAPTPNLDEMARDGMKFLSAYSEPSCTPTRLALLTGRQPHRTGLNVVLWPGQKQGLVAEEVTIAELLKEGGYDTAMWGKWHVGDVYDEHLPHNQGFDYAQYSPYNGAIWAWQDSANWPREYAGTAGKGPFFLDVPEDYFERFGYEPHYVYEARAGEEPTKVMPANCENYQDIDDKRTDAIIDYVSERADSDKPFFIYFPSDATNAVCANPEKYRFAEHVDSANNMAVTLVQHDANIGRLLKSLEDLGIAENTLVIWYSDNGPMHGFFPSAGYSHFRGGKGDVTEGGVRVPALAWWPGVIEPDQEPIDLLHVADVFTTLARIGGVADKIPNDRVTDGIDQTAFLLMGEDHSRRHYMFHYSGTDIGAVRFGKLKMHFKGLVGGLPQFDMYNIMRDPREEVGGKIGIYPYLHTPVPFGQLVQMHLEQMQQFPDRQLDPTTGKEVDARRRATSSWEIGPEMK
jgi:arylsulfatase